MKSAHPSFSAPTRPQLLPVAFTRDKRKLARGIEADALDRQQHSTEVHMSPKLDERISSLESKLKALKTRQQRVEARARALASRRERKDDTRRKILIGATMLARIDRNELDHADLRAWLDAHLTRDDDRALFELPPREVPKD